MGLFKIFKRLTRKGRKKRAAKRSAAALKEQTSAKVAKSKALAQNQSFSSLSHASKSSAVSSSFKPSLKRSTYNSSSKTSVDVSARSLKSTTVLHSTSVSASSNSRMISAGSNSKSASSKFNQVSSVNAKKSSTASSSSSVVSTSHASHASQANPHSTELKSNQVHQRSQSAKAPVSAKSKSQTPAKHHVDKNQAYSRGLAKSRSNLGQKLNRLFANFRSVNTQFFDDLEDTLIEADVGFNLAVKLTDELRDEVKLRNVKKRSAVQNVIIKKLIDLYDQSGKNEDNKIHFAKTGPTVFLFVGVNGAGKTTTIGKMAHMYHAQGKKVLLAAADTFRAGAIEQLDDWAKIDHVDIVKKAAHSDPSSVVYDAVHKAKREHYDILFVDTAGRLQNKVNLMNQLAKMKRVLTRVIPQAPHEVMLVLDATVGQNALSQAKLFKKVTDVTGIVLTKLDGTAKGGIVLAIRNDLHLPVKYVGLGEQVDDLAPFRASSFVYGLFKGLFK